MDRDLEGLEGKAFPLVGSAVADAPPSAGRPPQHPFEGGSALGFAVIQAAFSAMPPATTRQKPTWRRASLLSRPLAMPPSDRQIFSVLFNRQRLGHLWSDGFARKKRL